MMNKCATFYGDIRNGYRLKFIPASAIELLRRPILCTILQKWATSAYLTNFFFEFSYAVLTEDAALFLLHHGAKK